MARPDADDEESEAFWDRQPYKALRQLAAIAIIIGVLLAVAGSYGVVPSLAACRQEVTPSSTVVTVCHPIGTDDIVLVGLVLLVAIAFISPDLSEFGIPGLVNLKKTVRETKKKTDANTSVLEDLVSTREVPDLPQASASVDEKQEDAGDVAAPTPAVAGELTADRGPLEAELASLIDDVREHERASRLSAAEYVGYRAKLPRATLESLREWRSRFADEIASLVGLRPILTYAPERLSDEELRAGIALGRRLLDAANSFLSHKAIETRALEWVADLERRAGRVPQIQAGTDMGIDISSPPRRIEVKGSAMTPRRVFVTDNEITVGSALPDYYIYVVENLTKSTEHYRLRVLPGPEALARVEGSRTRSIRLDGFPSMTDAEALEGRSRTDDEPRDVHDPRDVRAGQRLGLHRLGSERRDCSHA
jgi:hypothetical protein